MQKCIACKPKCLEIVRLHNNCPIQRNILYLKENLSEVATLKECISMAKNNLFVFFILGFVFFVIGLTSKQTTFWILGFSFLAIGLSGFSGKKRDKDQDE